ncbi:DUF4352 domain-containing protein [Streptomyces albidoflavus]|uniref:DUF4352 domain-containing protein n=1 Tax=Streptomyces TaxID=1883 RepID=UPI001E44903B|nr:DUF4352 domain-containing protein [Streptomyces sp. OUCMDZ-3434]WSB22155.1 DUF4352 domain-containing protein [Streptomyces albidoflavus]
MSQPNPGPHWQQPGQHPQWAQQTQPGPHELGPAPYQPSPPSKKGMPAWAIVLITLGGIFVCIMFIGVLAGGSDSSSETKKPTTGEAPEKEPAKKDDGKADTKPADKPGQKPAEPAPVQITVRKTAFKPSVLHGGGDFTSVEVTITNNSDEEIDVNPLYFSITDTDGSKHNAELGMDENQMDLMDLAPGEKTTGVITGKGAFTPKYVTYTDGLFGDGVRGDVS